MAAFPCPRSIFSILERVEEGPALRWLQDASRTANLIDTVFSVEREATYNHVLRSFEILNGVHVFTLEPASAPAGREPFCDAQVEEAVKLQALYFSQCTRAVKLSTPVLAYLRREVHTYCRNLNVLNGEPLHSVLFISPSFTPSSASLIDPFRDAGMIIDPSAHQMGFQETISCAAEYIRDKFNIWEGHSVVPLGSHLREFQVDFLRYHRSLDEYNCEFRLEVSIRVICNILFRQLEDKGGARAIMDLEQREWGQFLEGLRLRLEEGLRRLRAQLDGIDFSTLSEEDRHDQEEELMSLHNKEGYIRMMALVRDTLS
ncbi:uncharacterized protein N0V89_000508 [Didymosphaeria variabile]|uniref:Uncharacterized protein n=1 Tax=Didymosphaeria variabile TaxID=1932322 RepID=A0A9W8XUF8_9PLEO|nr:uncharacterized protein N0V89_000508 [Didymosphaeria variabile]KAJ4359949.1 hypothetical protein N0V89_000508 [Didymosphaeria variabile]